MSETKFTPGPWGLDSTGSVVTADGGYVAEAYDGLRSTDNDPYIGAANARLIAAAPALYEALSGVEFIFSRPGEDSVERFERLAAAFYRDTGGMMPGKDTPAAGDQPDIEESRKKYDAWIDAKVAAARSALLLANTGETENG